jgi:hypothetical protein
MALMQAQNTYIDNATTKERNMTKTISTGNNESLSRGVFRNADGTWTAMTYSQSKTFKTESGARRWFSARA